MGGHAYVPEGRLLLTGDAAGLVDPLTGEGIYSAVVSGQAAAAAIVDVAAASRSCSTEALLSTQFLWPHSRASQNVADRYSEHLQTLQRTFALSYQAAIAFYGDPCRGMKIMRTPVLRRAVLKSYTHGLLTSTVFTSRIYRAALSTVLRVFQSIEAGHKVTFF